MPATKSPRRGLGQTDHDWLSEARRKFDRIVLNKHDPSLPVIDIPSIYSIAPADMEALSGMSSADQFLAAVGAGMHEGVKGWTTLTGQTAREQMRELQKQNEALRTTSVGGVGYQLGLEMTPNLQYWLPGLFQ